MNKRTHFFCLILLLGMFVPSISTAATLYAIIVGDTNISDIGASVEVDMERMEKLMNMISENTDLTLKLQKIIGNDLTNKNVKNAINRISPKSDDVVFFYWSGHGYNSGGSVLPTMHINKINNQKSNVKLSDVTEKINKKKSRLFILIGDTCNTSLNANRRDFNDTFSRKSSENFEELFLKYKGTVFASGAEVGGYSYGNKLKGGAYTTIFLNNLMQELSSSGIPSWDKLMERANDSIIVGSGITQQPISKTSVSYLGTVSPNPDPCKNIEQVDPDGTSGSFIQKQKCNKLDPNDPNCW